MNVPPPLHIGIHSDTIEEERRHQEYSSPLTDASEPDCTVAAQDSEYETRLEKDRGGYQSTSVSTAGNGTESKLFSPITPKPPKSSGLLLRRINSIPDHYSFQVSLKDFRDRFARLQGPAYDWWHIELCACFISTLAMITLVLVIRHYEGKPLPTWPLHITIGTFIAVCSKTMSAMLLVAIMESMGQYKWYTYQQTAQSLDHLGLIDKASRGVAGSVSLLVSKRWRSFASLGAIIQILAIAIEPCFQEAVRTPQGRVVADFANRPAIARIQSYTHPWPIQLDLIGSPQFKGDYTAEKPVKAAVYEGLFGDARAMSASCLTGDCEWNNLKSLAVCNSCQDITPLIDSRYSLPNGLKLDNATLINATTSPITLSEIGYTPWTLLNMSIMSRETAYECSVFWCVKEYNTSMVNGTVLEQTVANWSNDSLLYDHRDLVENLTPVCVYETGLAHNFEGDLTVTNGPCKGGIGCCFINFYANRSQSEDMTFKVDFMTHHTLRSFLQTTLQGNITLPFAASPVYSPDLMQAFATLLRPLPAHSNFTSVEEAIGNLTLVDIPQLMDNITDSVSIRLRQAVNTEDPNSPAIGIAYQMQPIIEFRYLWLLFPGFLLLSSILFLVESIRMTSRNDKGLQLWKSSLTPLLFHGLAEELRNKAAKLLRLSELDKQAQDTEVRLKCKEEGWRFVLEEEDKDKK